MKNGFNDLLNKAKPLSEIKPDTSIPKQQPVPQKVLVRPRTMSTSQFNVKKTCTRVVSAPRATHITSQVRTWKKKKKA